MIPIDSGVTGLMYNSDVVTTTPTSWADLFDPSHKDQATIEDNPEVAMQVGALAMGITDPVNLTEDQINQVKDYLIEHRDNFRTYWSSDADIQNLMAQGEVSIAEGYPGQRQRPQQGRRGQHQVLAGQGRSDRLDLRLRHQLLGHERERRLRAAQLLRVGQGPAVRGQPLELHDDQRGRGQDRAGEALVEEARLDAPAHFGNIIPASPPPNFDLWIKAWNEVKAAG